jgi:hypothetical protein
MDLPTAESQDGLTRVITSENDRLGETGKQVLLVESEVLQVAPKLKKKPSATGFFRQNRHNMFMANQTMTQRKKLQLGLALPPGGPEVVSDYT